MGAAARLGFVSSMVQMFLAVLVLAIDLSLPILFVVPLAVSLFLSGFVLGRLCVGSLCLSLAFRLVLLRYLGFLLSSRSAASVFLSFYVKFLLG